MCPDGPKARLRISAAFPAKPLRPPVTCFRRKQIYSTITAIELHVPVAFATAPAAKHVQEFHLIPLFRNKDACPLPDGSRVAHLPQNKPDIYLHRRIPGGGFCFLDTAASAPTAGLREEKLFLGQSKQLNGSSDSIGKS